MFGKRTLSVVFVCVGVAAGARPAAAEVHVTMNAGRVTVSAKNATVGQILAEWAKVGQTRIVNAERVGGGLVTLELTNVPEVEAIGILLRSAGGYVLAPRRADTPNASRYDRILILPQSAPATSAPRVATAPPAQPRPFGSPQPGQLAIQQPVPTTTMTPRTGRPLIPASKLPARRSSTRSLRLLHSGPIRRQPRLHRHRRSARPPAWPSLEWSSRRHSRRGRVSQASSHSRNSDNDRADS